MRRMYIHEHTNWPNFKWNNNELIDCLVNVRHKQGHLLGQMKSLGFQLRAEATLQTLTLDVLKSSEIEGEFLNYDEVRSSVARRLGMDIAGLIPADRHVEGIVEMMMDATQNYEDGLTRERLFDWHAALFPTGRSGMQKIVVGSWRDNSEDDPMQVVSGPMGRERVHFQAPDGHRLEVEMGRFLNWFNDKNSVDTVIKAAIAHLWFVTIHPFDDGNGRIARAIADMQLARADNSNQRFYSMSTQIRVERRKYYNILEKTQRGSLDITAWLYWFIECLDRALTTTNETLARILSKARFWDEHKFTPFNDRQRTMLNKLFDGFKGKLTSSKWAKINKCSQDTAGRDINDLIRRGILVKDDAGGRSTNYRLQFTVLSSWCAVVEQTCK